MSSEVKSNEMVRENHCIKTDPTKPDDTSATSSHESSDGTPASRSSHGYIIREMDQAYCSVNNEHSCDVIARKAFARRAALASFCVNFAYLLCGALFFASQTEWAAVDVALFTVYTVTSAGYGHVPIPSTPLFQIFNIFYILIGLSLMAIMMAQCYRFVELEASQLKYASDKAEVLRQGIDRLKQEPPSQKRDEALKKLRQKKKHDLSLFGKTVLFLNRILVFSVENPWGDFLQRIASLLVLALSGAIIVGTIEGWPWYTCIYWAVVSLTTVGYGDVVPETVAGKAFTTVWLPLNLFFLSILFCSVGHYYLLFADMMTCNIQRNMQAKLRHSTRGAAASTHFEDPELGVTIASPRLESEDDDNSETSYGPQLRGPPIPPLLVPRRSADMPRNRRFLGAGWDNMQDVLNAVHNTTSSQFRICMEESHVGELPEETFTNLTTEEAPDLYLRVQVKERMAYIVAEEIAGRHSSLSTGDKAGMVSVFLGGTVEAAEKWNIPRSARRAFRAVAFEALLFVGEHTLIREGDSALLRLTPMEFHRIFSPLLVAMGGKDVLDSWLTSTDILWAKESTRRRHRRMSVKSLHAGHKDFAKNGDKVQFPKNHAEGFHLFHDT